MTIYQGGDPSDDRHNTPPVAAPSPVLIPGPVETMRAAIKEALRRLLMVDVVNDEDDEIVSKLRGIADGLIEAL